jgi:hypothetical protein
VWLPDGGETRVTLYGKVRRENIQLTDSPPNGIEWEIDETRPEWLTIKLAAKRGYGAKTTLTLLDGASGEKIRLFISPGGDFKDAREKAESSRTGLFYVTLVIGIGALLYVVARITQRPG